MRSVMSGIASELEDDFRPQTTKRLGRRRRDHVAMLPELSRSTLGVGRLAGRISSNTRKMTGSYHDLEEVVRDQNETFGFVSSVQAVTGLHGQHG